jgi:beta-galactosidase
MIRGVRILALTTSLLATAAQAAPRETIVFDGGWLFAKGDQAGAEAATFTDARWTKVDLPHDWAIAGPFAETAAATGSGAFLPTGVAWYRKHFTAPTGWKGRRVFVELDGVMERSGVWINGMHLGYRPSGYLPLRYELTPFLRDGGNVIAVRADTSSQPASRWYAGSGINRHVRLIVTGDVHLDADATAVRTTAIGEAAATVTVTTAVLNQAAAERSARLTVDLVDPDGKIAATATGEPFVLAPGRTVPTMLAITLPRPHRWDIGDPALYTARVRVVGSNGQSVDDETIRFGVRDARFEAASGFWLNGRNIKLKGVAIHADGGAFGAAVPLAFYERRLRVLMALGVNAVRTAHNPFPPEFLDLCDRLGLLVMGEPFDMWTVAKNAQDYHLFFTDWSSTDATAFVHRDRNHPSIVIWSIGNEIHDTAYPIVTQSIIARLKSVFHAEDPTRPVTMALFRPNTTHDYENGTADMLDVVGQNYRETELAKAHADKPTRAIIGTENSKNRESWIVVRDSPAYSGMFLWTGADYLGEADRIGWPAISNPSGLVDRTDHVKPIGWERASWWSANPVVKIARRVTPVIDTSELPTMVGVAMPQPKGPGVLADWSPTDRTPHDETVEVYSNAPEVELIAGGRSLGRRSRNADDKARQWTVPFVPGTIRAVGYDGKRVVARDELATAGAPAAIRLTPTSHTLGHGFDAVGFIEVAVVDAKGVVVPDAASMLTASVEGGTLAAFDNASITDHTAFTSSTRAANAGRALVMVRAGEGNAPVVVSVASPGLKTGTARVRVN